MKVFRNLRKRFLNSNKIGNYLKYAIGEIALVVIGILIAIQINNWNSQKLLDQKEVQAYQQIKRQLSDDLKEITEISNINNYYYGLFSKANQLISEKDYSKIDSLVILTMNLSKYSDFNGSGNIYETLVNSGDIKLINNTEIISKLQRLEMTYSALNKIEDMNWEIIMKELSPEIKGVINYSNLQIIKPEKLYAVELQNIYIESIFLTKGKEMIYNKALSEIETIIGIIDETLIN